MALYRMFDAAYPPARPYPGCAAVAGYIGGNTPHVWTLAEWLVFQDLVQFPIWVGYGDADPAADAAACLAQLGRFGWAANRPNRRMVLLDYETAIDPAWINAFASPIWQAGFETGIYGSQSTVLRNPPKEGRWIALYNGQPVIPAGEDAIGHQYQADIEWAGTQVDLSVITDVMLSHGGAGPRANN